METQSQSQLRLWETKTLWFHHPQTNELYSMTFPYKSWKDFRDCRPYKMWKPYAMTSWCWKEDQFQIVFATPYKVNVAMHFVEFAVTQQDEDEIRTWIRKHMPEFWKV